MNETIRQYREKQQEIAQDYFSKGEIASAIRAQDIAERIGLAIEVANDHTTRDISHTSVTNLPGNIAGTYQPSSQKSSIKTDLLNTASHMTIAHVLVHEDGGHHDNRAKGDNQIITSIDVEEGLNEIATGQELGHKPLAYEAEQQLARDIARASGSSVNTLVSHFQNGTNAAINEAISTAAANDSHIANKLAA